jgi:capsular polysaccharide biosynthesis protein
MDYRENLEIDFLDMLRCVLKKWRVVLVFMLIGMICAGVYGYFIPNKPTSEATVKKQQEAAANKQLATLSSKLTDAETREVNMAVQSYLESYETYLRRVEYGRDSIRMNLDAINVPSYVLSYRISGYSDSEEMLVTGISEADNIVALYMNAINDPELFADIRSELGWEVSDSYINELIEVTKSGLSIMNVTMMAPSQEEVTGMAEVVDSYIMTYAKDIQSKYTHTLEKMGGSYYQGVNNTLLSKQKDLNDGLITTGKAIISFQSSLTADQKTYFMALLNMAEKQLAETGNVDISALTEGTEGVSSAAASKTTTTKTGPGKKIRKKYILAGGVAGAFAILIWYAILYVLSATLKTRNDLSGAFRLSVMGEFVPEDQYKRPLGGLDRLIDSLFMKKLFRLGKEEQFKMIAKGIGAGAAKEGTERICISGSSNDSFIEGIRKQISEDGAKELDGSGTIVAVDSPLGSSGSLEELAGADGAVLVERAGVTKYDDLSTIIALCDKYGVKILGTVLVY